MSQTQLGETITRYLKLVESKLEITDTSTKKLKDLILRACLQILIPPSQAPQSFSTSVLIIQLELIQHHNNGKELLMLCKGANCILSLTQLTKGSPVVVSIKMLMESDYLLSEELNLLLLNHSQRPWDFMVSALVHSTLSVLIRMLPPECFLKLRL